MTVSDADIIDCVHRFFSETVGFAVPRGGVFEEDWRGLDAGEVERRSQMFSNRENREIMAWESRAAAAARIERIDLLAGRAAGLVGPATSLTSEVIARDFRIDRPDLAARDMGDLIYPKINHGFWEQYFSILHDGYVETVMRPKARHNFITSYLTSRFSDALLTAIRALAVVEEDEIRFPGVDFGFSFNAGDLWHADWLRRQSPETLTKFLVPKGVYAGAKLFFSEVADVPRLAFADGAYPKCSLLDGTLAPLCDRLAAVSDHIVFCVPPHLAGIRLIAAPEARQENIFVSGRLVHHAWPITLAGTTRSILRRLADGAHVTVFSQGAVFSGLMGLYLAHAKRALQLPGRLSYIDLGQALDAARLDHPGLWASTRRNAGVLTEDSDIPFRIGQTSD